MARKFRSAFIAAVGYVLSPLSWWNDLFVNIPLAYLFAIPFALVSERLFLPAFIFGYWLSNFAGLVLLHYGIKGLASPRLPSPRWWWHLLVAMAYTAVVAALVLLGGLRSPLSYLR